MNVSQSNNSVAALSAAATFTGGWERAKAPSIVVAVKTDQDSTLRVDFSPDGVNLDSTLTFGLEAGINDVHRITTTRQYFRVRVTNDSASGQTYMRLQTMQGGAVQLNSPLNGTVQQDADAAIARTITEELPIARGLFSGIFQVNKFGRNSDVDEAEDIWRGGGDYTGFPSGSAETLTLTSGSGSTDEAATVHIYGLDTNLELQDELVTLNASGVGVTVGTYKRMYRAMMVTPASGQTTNAGAITITHTTTTANVFAVVPAGVGQTEISNYTVPAGYTAYMIRYSATIFDNTSNRATVAIWVREENKSVRLLRPFTVATNADLKRDVYGGLALPEKTDVKFRCTDIINANGDITVEYDLIVVKN